MKRYIFLLTALLLCGQLMAKDGYWQQGVNYNITILLNTDKHSFTGKTVLEYTNNSNEVLYELYFHLYNNAFQPNSEMDVFSRTVQDPDRRVGDRISKLNAAEEGHMHVTNIFVNGIACEAEEQGTILHVKVEKGITEKAIIEFEFSGQVPLQIRRSGRNNAEGIEYSMSQWYPKLCEFDTDGWHPNPYVGREFYGVWGDFQVSITLPANYIVAAGGILLNESECAVEKEMKKFRTNTWKYKAENVHDFVWAADPDYEVVTSQVKDGPILKFYFQGNQPYAETWKQSTQLLTQAFEMLSSNYGKYPYPVYNFIQGGDGGMEYPMATLITGNRKLPSLVGVGVHEGAHSWFQGLLGTNESLYAWMDEGFTSYASTEVMNRLFPTTAEPHHEDGVSGYVNLAQSGMEEPLTTHADHFKTNYAYSLAAYSKGETYLHQMRTIVGEDVFKKVMHSYFDAWSFKHPTSEDFIRIAEKESGLVLDWYDEYFVKTTKTIDYAVDTVIQTKQKLSIALERIGEMPMPCEVTVEFENGKSCVYYIPFELMRGVKNKGVLPADWQIAKPWRWCDTKYTLNLNTDDRIKKVMIDANLGVADIDLSNNSFPKK